MSLDIEGLSRPITNVMSVLQFMRCSVKGLSLLMFFFVTMGDFTYLFSVLLFSVDKVFIIRTLPWILGSGWSLFFDIFVSAKSYPQNVEFPI